MVLSHVFPRAAAAVIGLVLASPLCLPVPASANVVFDFNGVCATGCSGIATGVLTLADSYVFGSDITTLELISFDYSSSQFSFNLTRSDVAFIAGGLNADGSFNSTETLTVQALTSTPVFVANAVGF